MAKQTKKNTKNAPNKESKKRGPAYPRHELEKVTRLPEAIIREHAGDPCTEKQLAEFVGVGFHGPFQSEIASALKYQLLEKGEDNLLKPTDIAKQIQNGESPESELAAIRTAITGATVFKDVYDFYRGGELASERFFRKKLIEQFGIPQDKLEQFEMLFLNSLRTAKLLEEKDGKRLVLQVNAPMPGKDWESSTDLQNRLSKSDSCFVLMPFELPIGDYYKLIFDPAIELAGLTPRRADSDIFGAGKIMDQVWSGIESAKMCIAVLTDKNPNVFYELGIAHTLKKPVILVAADMEDVPSDLRGIRVIIYDKDDPYWGKQLKNDLVKKLQLAASNPEFVFDHNKLSDIPVELLESTLQS